MPYKFVWGNVWQVRQDTKIPSSTDEIALHIFFDLVPSSVYGADRQESSVSNRPSTVSSFVLLLTLVILCMRNANIPLSEKGGLVRITSYD